MTTEQQRIISRIKKLQAHAESARQLGSLNEYFAFAQRVSQLLTKYNLNQMDLEADEPTADEQYLRSYGFSKLLSYQGEGGSGWRRQLLHVLCEFNYCRNLGYTRIKKVKIYGRGENVETTTWLYLFLNTHFLLMARDAFRVYIPAKRKKERLSRHKFLRDFLLGAVDGLQEYYQQQRAAGDSALIRYSDTALDKFAQAAGLQIVMRRVRPVRVNGQVYNAGLRVGREALRHERKLQKETSIAKLMNEAVPK